MHTKLRCLIQPKSVDIWAIGFRFALSIRYYALIHRAKLQGSPLKIEHRACLLLWCKVKRLRRVTKFGRRIHHKSVDITAIVFIFTLHSGLDTLLQRAKLQGDRMIIEHTACASLYWKVKCLEMETKFSKLMEQESVDIRAMVFKFALHIEHYTLIQGAKLQNDWKRIDHTTRVSLFLQSQAFANRDEFRLPFSAAIS